MLSKTRTTDVHERDFFKVLLEDLVSCDHPLVQLARKTDWSRFEALLAGLFCPGQGRYSCPARLMVGLVILKELSGIGSKAVFAQWAENPYWQYFTGGVYFEHRVPAGLRSLARWQHRLRHCGGETLLAEMLGDSRSRRALTPAWAVRHVREPREKTAATPARARRHARTTDERG